MSIIDDMPLRHRAYGTPRRGIWEMVDLYEVKSAEVLVRITVRFDQTGFEASESCAELLLLDEEAQRCTDLHLLREYPSNWWKSADQAVQDGDDPGDQLNAVAAELAVAVYRVMAPEDGDDG